MSLFLLDRIEDEEDFLAVEIDILILQAAQRFGELVHVHSGRAQRNGLAAHGVATGTSLPISRSPSRAEPSRCSSSW